MKAVYITEHGDVDNFIYGELPDPTIGPQEVLLRVRAAALNRRDIFSREGSHGIRGQFPQVIGMDVAGEVVQVGPAVTQFKEGDRVLGLCPTGTYAEYTKGRAEDLYHIPPGLSFEEASTITVVFSTAWRMLVRRAQLKLGEDVLVMAAGSGVGIAAIQIAKRAGARVFTTASSDEKLEKAKALGAEFGINYKREDFAQKVKELTGGQGVDIVIEHIGTPVWEQCFNSLKPRGRFVTCGVSAGHLVQLHLGRLWTRDLTVMGVTMRPREDMPAILPLIARGELRPVVSAVFPLHEAAKAHAMMETSDFFGKIVLVP